MSAFVDITPGCECGAWAHEGQTHEAALACEAVCSSTACDCGGYYDHDTGEVGHDGYCPLCPDDEPEALMLSPRLLADLAELRALGVTIS